MHVPGMVELEHEVQKMKERGAPVPQFSRSRTDLPATGASPTTAHGLTTKASEELFSERDHRKPYPVVVVGRHFGNQYRARIVFGALMSERVKAVGKEFLVTNIGEPNVTDQYEEIAGRLPLGVMTMCFPMGLYLYICVHVRDSDGAVAPETLLDEAVAGGLTSSEWEQVASGGSSGAVEGTATDSTLVGPAERIPSGPGPSSMGERGESKGVPI